MMLRAMKSPSAASLTLASGERRPTSIRKPESAASTNRPFWRTLRGRRGSIALIRFCTSTCASSGLVPGLKVAVIEASPEVSTDDSKYSRCLTLDSSRSISPTTASFSVCGLAPG